MKHLTDEEILDVATQHCAFTGEGYYHLNKYTGWAIVRVVRECFDLAELCRQAESAKPEPEAPSKEACAKCGGTDEKPWCELTQTEWCGRSNPGMLCGNDAKTDAEMKEKRP